MLMSIWYENVKNTQPYSKIIYRINVRRRVGSFIDLRVCPRKVCLLFFPRKQQRQTLESNYSTRLSVIIFFFVQAHSTTTIGIQPAMTSCMFKTNGWHLLIERGDVNPVKPALSTLNVFSPFDNTSHEKTSPYRYCFVFKSWAPLVIYG